MAESRQLAAIMFSDIEGYTRMIETDERQGRQAAIRYRKVLEEQLARFGGTLINTYGDGSLCIFPSAVQAVRCAGAIQLEMIREPRVPLRIGLHLGDIVVDGQDVYGSGVNVASRIESMGVAGSVLVSASICREVKNHEGFRLVSLGHFDFKNIDQPMEVFALRNEGLVVPEVATLKGKFKEKVRKTSPFVYMLGVVLLLTIGWWVGRRPADGGGVIQSMAVLPPQILSNVADQEIVREGLHEGLISSLGQLASVRVISKNSTMSYRESDKSLEEISKELQVDGVVTGDVDMNDDSVHVNLRLVKTMPREQELWSHSYRESINQILRLYEEIRSDIARRINVDLASGDINHQPTPAATNPETYKAYVRGMYFLNKSTPQDFQKGMQYLLDAVEIDPADPMAYAGLARGYAIMGHGPDPEEQVWRRGRAAAMQAIKLDPNNANAHTVLGAIKAYYEWDWKGAEQAYLRALEINPNHAFAHFQYAWYLICFGRWEEAIEHHLLAKELDPLFPIYTADMGNLYLYLGEVDKALKEVQEALELDPEFAHSWWTLGNVYAQKGMFEEAIEAHQHAASIHPIWRGALGGTYARAGKPEKARAILAEFKSREISPRMAYWIAYIHLTLGEYDEVFEWLNYEYPDPWLIAIRTWPEFRVLYGDPRFEAFLKRLGQPPVENIQG